MLRTAEIIRLVNRALSDTTSPRGSCHHAGEVSRFVSGQVLVTIRPPRPFLPFTADRRSKGVLACAGREVSLRDRLWKS